MAGRPYVDLATAGARLRLDLAGGALASFELLGAGPGAGVNPLVWDSAVHDGGDAGAPAPRPRGHFLCLDRWGLPSLAEEASGMTPHGEASVVTWESSEAEGARATMAASLPMAGMRVERKVRLLAAADAQGESAVAVAAEVVTNENKLGRVYNMVQHPSIAAPFLGKDTVVDCNGVRGFAQGPNRVLTESPAEPTFLFPKTINRAGQEADARTMTGGDDDVQSYEVDPGSSFGWVCAASPAKGLLLGYAWPREDYPWVSLWCCSREDGTPAARGLEFGTTGLHQPFAVLAHHPRLLGLPTSDFLDAGERRERRYASFLLRVPADFEGVASIAVVPGGGALTLVERGQGRAFTLKLKEEDSGLGFLVAQ